MSISVYCQWCGAANNTAGRCTDMMCRGGDTRPAVVEVGIDLRDAEIAALRARVAALEAVERAAREYRRLQYDSLEATHGDSIAASAARRVLDAALASLEVPRG